MLPFEPVAKLLLFAHHLAAVATVGAAVHLALRSRGLWHGVGKPRLQQLHARILLLSYAVCWGLGAALYPVFRVRVRAELFDPAMPWATGLFEAKEHLANVGLLAVLGVWLLVPHLPRADGDDRRAARLFCLTLGLLLAILGYNAWCGWYLTTLKAV